MIKHVLILIVFLLIMTSMQALEFPITFPADGTGMEVTYLSDPNRYKLRFTYNLHETENKVSFIVPVPGSNEFQTVTITSVSQPIEDIKRDISGNTVIITKPFKAGGLKKSIVVECEVAVRAAKFSLPTTYSYALALQNTFHEQFNKEPFYRNIKPQTDRPGYVFKDEISRNMILEFITAYKTLVSQDADWKKRIYDEKVSDFYPIPTWYYQDRALDFLFYLKKAGITGMIGQGWMVPPKMDSYSRDFIVLVHVPGKGYLILDKMLNPFINNGSFILWKYETPYEEVGDGGVLKILKNQHALSPASTLNVNAGLFENGNSVDKRFNTLVDTIEVKEGKKYPADTYLIQDTSIVDNGVDAIVLAGVKSGRVYAVEPVSQYAEYVAICSSVSNHKPVGTDGIYKIGTRIHAYLKFKSTKSNKLGYVKWIKPDGALLHTKELDVPGNWGYSYTYIQPREKGLWTVELYLYGKLEAREHFELQ